MRRIIKVFIFGVLFLFPVLAYAAELNINFIAVNPKNEPAKMEIKKYLPRELEPEDIVDPGKLKVDFDVNKSDLYAHGNISFAPKESKTFKIVVKDVWQIKTSEIDLLKDQLRKNVDMLKGDPNYQSALYVRDKLLKQMDFILNKQSEFKGNIERRIEEYRANATTLQSIRDKIYNEDFLKFESKSIEVADQEQGTIKMVIQVKNPSDEKALKIKEKHFLPKEVREEDVVNADGFDIRYDDAKGKEYLTKETTFKPGEIKTYTVVLKDIWKFPDIKVQDLEDRSQIAELELDGTNFQESAHHLYDGIKQKLEEIRLSKELDTNTARHIGLFRLNSKRYKEAYADFKRIEEMISIVRAKKLQEMEHKKVKNVLQRLKALRGLKQLSEALFKKRLSLNVTWKIIFGTMGFVAFFTSFHFFLWARRSKKMGEDLGPKGGEGITVVPKPGENEEEEEE